MENIFHEKQEGYLCAQHCLNALLQGQYFNAVDLANLADQLDADERRAMAESGEDTDDYRRFLEQPSGNMDDSGYFSIQVISRALRVWGLELIPYASSEPTAIEAQRNPSQMKAYICNYKGHWLTIRKIGNQWFDLNSMLNGPQYISDTHLAMYLAQLIQEGYSIFMVMGTLPQCEADEILLKNPVSRPRSTAAAAGSSKFMSQGYRLGTKAEEEARNIADVEAKILQTAQALGNVTVPSTSRRPDVEIISESVRQPPRERIIPIKLLDHNEKEVHWVVDDEENEENAQLQKALAMSLQNYELEQEERKRERLESPSTSGSSSSFGLMNPPPNPVNTEEEEDDELKRALQLSLECVTAPPTPDREEIRWHRLNHLNMISRNSQPESSTQKLNT